MTTTTTHHVANHDGVVTVRVASETWVANTVTGDRVEAKWRVVTEVADRNARRTGTHVSSQTHDSVASAAVEAAATAAAVRRNNEEVA